MLVGTRPHVHVHGPDEESLPCLSFLSGVELNKPTHFTVSTKGAGKANLDCTFSGPTKAEAAKDVEIINNHDNTHTVKYTPVQQVGTCAGQPVPGSSTFHQEREEPLVPGANQEFVVLRVLWAWL